VRLRQFPGVRLPIPVVLLLCLAVVAGLWWHGTRNANFLTPPLDTKLSMIREKVASSVTRTLHPDHTVSPPVTESKPSSARPTHVEEERPALELGDFASPPVLHEYAEPALRGARHLIDLAGVLERKDQPQRALLAWERVLDLGDHNDSQAKTAIAAIKRLRPTLPPWNTESSKAISITLHATTGRKNVKLLKPLLDETANEIERASSGILNVNTNLIATKDGKATTTKDTKAAKAATTPPVPAPVAIWLTGRGKATRSTEVMSFTPETPEALAEELRKTAFNLISGHLVQGSSRTPPMPIAEGEPALDALNSHITLLYWKVLGNLLNQAPPVKPPEKKQ
jgi:hypothetical protein